MSSRKMELKLKQMMKQNQQKKTKNFIKKNITSSQGLKGVLGSELLSAVQLKSEEIKETKAVKTAKKSSMQANLEKKMLKDTHTQ